MARVLLMAQGARALRRAARHRRQVCGDARCARGGVPRGTPPALHGPLLPQRVGKGARDQEEGRGADAEGDPRAGIARGVLEEGGGGGGRAGRDEARRGREDGARRLLRDSRLHGLPAGALAQNPD